MCINMSDVRLSNTSPTLERVDARQPDSLRPSVRRCLFGSPDPEELREVFQAFKHEEERRFRDTYNFDPVEDKPLSPGRFEWEEWKDAPEFYRRPPHRRLKDRGRARDLVETAGDQSHQTAGDQSHQTAPTQDRPRKRPSGASGSSGSSEPQSKSSRSDGEEQDTDEGTAPVVSEQPSQEQ